MRMSEVQLQNYFGKLYQHGTINSAKPRNCKYIGEREGKVENKPAKLSIAQNGNNLSGSIVYDNVKEYLSGEITNDKIILRGTGYEGEVLVRRSKSLFQ